MQILMDSGCDVALIQEARLGGDSWEREHYNRGARIYRLSNRADVIGFRNIPQGRRPGPGEFAVSAAGTIAAARIIPENGLPFFAVSLYAPVGDAASGHVHHLARRLCRCHGPPRHFGPECIHWLRGPCHAPDSCRRRLQTSSTGRPNKIPWRSRSGTEACSHVCNRSGSSSWDLNIRTEGWPLRRRKAFRRTRRTFRPTTTPHASSQARQQTSSTTYLRHGGFIGTCGRTRSMNRNSGVRAIIAGS